MAIDDPSTRFPFINLEKAIGRAQQLFSADKGGKPMLMATAFEVWGYSPKSSGAFQTIAALKQYGLIFDDGANNDRRIALTPDARKYFLDERDDVRSQMLRDFALAPALIRVVWTTEEWSRGVPADTVARSHLKIERRLSDQSARAFLGIFKDNIRFAGLNSGVSAEPSVESAYALGDPEGVAETPKDTKMPDTHSGGAAVPIAPPPSIQAKPIVFDMETITVSASFDSVEDLRDFIQKLQKLEPLMPSKAH